MPQRIQLSRRKGWRIPEGTITVARPTRWGNPFPFARTAEIITERGIETVDVPDRAASVAPFRRLAAGEIRLPDREYPFADVVELRGRDLACWCSPDGPCHADVLLELANG